MKRKPATSLSPFANPLTVQFWLFGLDSSGGLLHSRGFERVPERRGERAYGSSRYRLHPLELHSSGLALHLPAGLLHYDRPRQSFRLGGEPVPRPKGLALLQPHIHEHEAWIERRHSGLRARQLDERLPRPVRHQVENWHAWVTRSLEPLVWQPLERKLVDEVNFWAGSQLGTGAAAQVGQRP